LIKHYRVCLALFLAISLVAISAATASAHEMFPGLRWIYKSADGKYLQLKSNGDYLQAPYADNYSNANIKWTSSSSPVIYITDTFANSNVDLLTPTTTWWTSKGLGSGVAAITVVQDTTGKEIWTATDASSSNKNISYANIYVNPSASAVGELWQNKVLVHEMGHVMDLGHPTSEFTGTSIMIQGELTYDTPQAHENTDLRSYYGL
jgi:hypothetical protein